MCDGREPGLRGTTVLRATLAGGASASPAGPERCKGRAPPDSGACNSETAAASGFHLAPALCAQAAFLLFAPSTPGQGCSICAIVIYGAWGVKVLKAEMSRSIFPANGR